VTLRGAEAPLFHGCAGVRGSMKSPRSKSGPTSNQTQRQRQRTGVSVPHEQNQEQRQQRRLQAPVVPTPRKGREEWGTLGVFEDGNSKSKSNSSPISKATDRSVGSTRATSTATSTSMATLQAFVCTKICTSLWQAKVNSRFLRSAVPFGFAQGPAPVGMTRF
jgi:hypothetical protein